MFLHISTACHQEVSMAQHSGNCHMGTTQLDLEELWVECSNGVHPR